MIKLFPLFITAIMIAACGTSGQAAVAPTADSPIPAPSASFMPSPFPSAASTMPSPSPSAASTAPGAVDSGRTAANQAIADEEYQVYQAVITSLYAAGNIKSIVIVDHTATYPAGDTSKEGLSHLQQLSGSAVSEILNDYQAKNMRSQSLDRRFALDLSYHLLPDAEAKAFMNEEDGWKRFSDAYPGSQGILTLSRVGFNADASQALVYAGNQAGPDGRGDYLLMSKKGGVWQIQNRIIAWIS